MNRLKYLSPNERQALLEFKAIVSNLLQKDLKKISLFGSKTKGKGSWESDLDVLLLIKDDASKLRNQIFDEAYQVNLKYGVYISPRIIPLKVYADPFWRMTPFLKHLRKEGILI